MQRVAWSDINAEENKLLSPAYKSNGHVFTSGSIGSDPISGAIPSDVSEQTENAIKNLQITLNASDSSLDKVLKVLLFVGHPSYASAINVVYAKYFTHAPARSAVVVSFPDPRLKIELECIAEYKELEQPVKHLSDDVI